MTRGPWKASVFLELHDYNAPSETERAGESRMYCELVSRLIVMVYLLTGTVVRPAFTGQGLTHRTSQLVLDAVSWESPARKAA